MFKSVDHCKHIIDESEVEILHAGRWACICGYAYDADKDGKGRAFRDLPLEWPCPECGQIELRLWTFQEGGGTAARDSNRTLVSVASSRSYEFPRHHELHNWALTETSNPFISHGSLFHVNLGVDTLSTECSSARSAGNCSGTFSSDTDSDNSWIDEYDTGDVASMRLYDYAAKLGCQTNAEDASQVVTDCYDEHGHVLTWTDGELWCPVCTTTVSWPFWPQHPSQERTSLAPANIPPPEDPAILCGDGKLQRKGIGFERFPVRPGLQAGGTAGPWWTRTDPRFVGK